MQDREDADYLSFIQIEESVLKQEIEQVKSLIELMEKLVQKQKSGQ